VSKFNTRDARSAVASPVQAIASTTARTYEGATATVRDARSELFLLAVANLGNDTFYEKAQDRDDRFTALVHQLAVNDPGWTAGLIGWLRTDANIRSAAIVAAAEFVKARLDGAGTRPARVGETRDHAGRFEGDELAYSTITNRRVIDSVLQRADEPGEMVAYWVSKYGKNLPKPVKRGIADAIQRLYTERSLLKYDSKSDGYRFGDVLELVHASPDPAKAWQGELFRYAIDERHNRDRVPELQMLLARKVLMQTPLAERRAVLLADGGPERLASAGMTWEALAGWLQGPMDAKAWEAVIPSMGIFALIRNLRNFDEAGVSDVVAAQVAAKISDPAVVASSRLFPFRFWAAYKATSSLRWAHALEQALGHSLANVPALPGKTLILVDRSPSMFPGYHYSTANRSDITLAEQAAVFGAALALRAEKPTLVEFGGTSKTVTVPKGGSVLRLIEGFGQIDGTDIPSAIKQHSGWNDRIVIVTDEQTRPGWLPSNMERYGGMSETQINDLIPAKVPVYMWNMAGYKAGAMPSGAGNRHTFGGLTDQAFRMVPMLEAGRDAAWPWM
jgi:hypothetical protein